MTGAVLLAVSLLGDLTPLGRYEDAPPRPWERFDPTLAAETPDLASLLHVAEERAGCFLRGLPAAQRMELLSGVVADRFTHGDTAKYSVFSNWPLWMLGLAVRRYRDIQDPDLLLRNGHTLLCGDVSFVLMRLADMSGIPARHVLLNGHIVMEAWYEDGWHAYDPDLEAAVRDGQGRVLSVREAAGMLSLLVEAYGGKGDARYLASLLAMIENTSDDRYLVYPRGGVFGGSGQRPGRVEQAAEYARYVVPLALLGAALVLLSVDGKKGGRRIR